MSHYCIHRSASEQEQQRIQQQLQTELAQSQQQAQAAWSAQQTAETARDQAVTQQVKISFIYIFGQLTKSSFSIDKRFTSCHTILHGNTVTHSTVTLLALTTVDRCDHLKK
jgi:hypothetical protein